MYVIQQDGAGKVLSQWTKTYDLQLSEKQYAALLKSGMPFNQDVQQGRPHNVAGIGRRPGHR